MPTPLRYLTVLALVSAGVYCFFGSAWSGSKGIAFVSGSDWQGALDQAGDEKKPIFLYYGGDW